MNALIDATRNPDYPTGGDRRRAPDRRMGRRRTDAWFPYSAAFVAQALAQAEPQARPQIVSHETSSNGLGA